MLEVKDLKVIIKEDGKEVLSDFVFDVKKSETHILLGQNGSGKSSFLMALFGSEKYEIVSGSAFLEGKDVFDMEVPERVYNGMFLSFQNPIGIPGLSVSNFLKHSINSVRRGQGKEPFAAPKFFAKLKEVMAIVGVDNDWLKKDVNVGFSGGEKKKLEMLEVILLEPKILFLDEPDSGVDVNAVEVIAKAINYMKKEFGTAIVLVSHYEKLVSLIDVDRVSILKDGHIVKTGDVELAKETLKKGFE